MAAKAIAVQHRWVEATFGRMTDEDLAALERQLVVLGDIVREEEGSPARRAAGA